MASSNRPEETIRQLRREHAGDGDALLVKTASVCGMGHDGSTPYVSPTSDGAEAAGMEIGDEVEVRIFDGAILIKTGSE